MGKIEKLCIRVLEFTKRNNLRISEKEFHKICGKQTDAVLADLKHHKIGTYVKGFKSIWFINRISLEIGLSHYECMTEEKKSSMWKWFTGIIISIIGTLIGILL